MIKPLLFLFLFLTFTANAKTALENTSLALNVSSNAELPLTASSVITNPSCGNTGSINLTASEGKAPYTFLWNDGATTEDRTNLSAGTYTVIITDANGSSFTKTEILVNSKPIINLTSVVKANCGFSNGSLTVQAQGGTAPYTYKLDGVTNLTSTFSNLVAGAYSITATDANGCATTQLFGVSDIEMVGTQVSKTDVSCNGASDGKIEVASASGAAPITYRLDQNGITQANGSFSGLAAGSHIITIYDGGLCIYTIPFTINEPPKLQVGVGVSATSTAGGANGAIALSPTGGSAPYTYNWGNGILSQNRTGLAAGTYSVTVTDAKGCTKTESITVGTTITTLPVTFGEFTATPQNNRVKLDWNTFSESNNQAFIIYRSADAVNYTEIAQLTSKGSNANSYTSFDNNPANGVNYYRLSQKDNDGTITALGNDAVNLSLSSDEVKVWPNPVDKTLKLSFSVAKYQSLKLLDINGKKLLERSIANTQSKIEIDMSTYPKGIYMVDLKGNQGSHLVKVIK